MMDEKIGQSYISDIESGKKSATGFVMLLYDTHSDGLVRPSEFKKAPDKKAH